MILKTRYCFSLYFAVLFCSPAMAQVQVSEEPMHRREIKAGKFLYIDPGASFYFNKDGTGTVSLVLFEIK